MNCNRIAALSRRRALAALAALGLASLIGAQPAEAQIIADPENTIVMEVGLGYDSPLDNTPDQTAKVVIELLPQLAPNHVARIKQLAREGYYDGKLFHRVIEGFMAQTGSPKGDGIGGAAGKPNLKAEFSNVKFERGVVGMARGSDEDSANAQFFITFARSEWLDRSYTVVGRVIEGMDMVDRIQLTQDQGGAPVRGIPDRIISMHVAADL